MLPSPGVKYLFQKRSTFRLLFYTGNDILKIYFPKLVFFSTQHCNKAIVPILHHQFRSMQLFLDAMGKDYLQILKDRQKKTESEKLARQQEYERKQYLSKTKEDLKDGSVIIWVSF